MFCHENHQAEMRLFLLTNNQDDAYQVFNNQ